MKSRETVIDILANRGLLSNIQPKLPGFLLARKLLYYVFVYQIYACLICC